MEEALTPMVEETVVETHEPESIEPQETEASQPEVQQPKETLQARNFRELREKALALQRERDEAVRLLKERDAQATPQAKTEPEEDDEVTLAPDELAEGKHLSKVGRKIKKLEQEMYRNQQIAQELAIEARIKSQFPDYDSIVTKENIEALRLLEPEVAQTIHESKDLYSKAVSAYKMIKKAGISQEDTYMPEKDRALKNAAKPRAMVSAAPQQGESPLQRANAFANGLTDELKKSLMQEMIAARKGY